MQRDEWEDFVKSMDAVFEKINKKQDAKNKPDSKTTPSASDKDDPPVCVNMAKDGTYSSTHTVRPEAEDSDESVILPKFSEKVRLVDSNGEKSNLFVRVDDDNMIHVGFAYNETESEDDYFLDLNWKMSQVLRNMLEHAEYAVTSTDIRDTE